LFLKRRHHYNIVIGGAAGSTGPLIAWAAVDGGLSLYAWVMFVIIFMWTPPHFWALALAIKDEYQEVGVPMLPVTHGVKRTKQEIWIYTWSLLPLSLVPWLMGEAGLVYLSSSLALWLWYLIETHLQLPQTDRKNYMRLFGVSILYLLFLFVGILIDGGVRYFS
jgi:protoheme IX farnesyltransferase